MFDWTSPPRAGQRLLDVGCAGGNQQARDLACTVIGLDEDPAVRPSVLGNAAAMPFPAASFDYVVCHHVLEHVVQPESALREVARVLKPDGGLSVAVPNGRGVCDGIYRYLFEGGGHVNRFRRAEIIDLVERTTGLGLARWRKLYSSFSYLSTVLPLLESPPPDLQRRLVRLRHLPLRAVRAAHAALYLGTRSLDRAFHSDLALYGWAFYFERSTSDPVELPAMVNVCVHCGAGSPAADLKRLGALTCLCPGCNRRTLYFPPFGSGI
ncbi:MAG TPA: class I SAM-dependent methyltransferase [Candidatus Acidoferrales bacterium]|nr:class I SAM-dependent methyltransferase [Candidatus Acidoferrales bacterium]